MGIEIERKFLVQPGRWLPQGPGVAFLQGYLSTHRERIVRVRIEGDVARLTVKGLPQGLARPEFEYPIPLEDARQLLELCEQPLVTKTRHTETHGGKTWVIDVFHGANEGLVLAEVELEAEDETVDLPDFVGEEVSQDPRYANSSLGRRPFGGWG